MSPSSLAACSKRTSAEANVTGESRASNSRSLLSKAEASWIASNAQSMTLQEILCSFDNLVGQADDFVLATGMEIYQEAQALRDAVRD